MESSAGNGQSTVKMLIAGLLTTNDFFMSEDPIAIFFDAGGTLFEVRGSVGKIYSDVARRYGNQVDPQILNAVFRNEFNAKSSQGFPPSTTGDSARAERQWWFELVQRVLRDFVPAGRLEACSAELYEFFQGADAWVLYPDVVESLCQLREWGFRLGIISNFDSRLREIVSNLGISYLFESVTTSWEVRAAKPEARIFRMALESMGIAPHEAIHVGDSIREDIEGALAAGITPVLLDRHGTHIQWINSRRIGSLTDLCSYYDHRQ